MKKLLIGLLALVSISAFSQSFSDRAANMKNGVICFMSIDANSNSVGDGVSFCQNLVKTETKNNQEISKSLSDRLEPLRSDGFINQ